ncbi:MAG: hypothetical protein OXF40_11390 [Rhodospirillales bacterium]|nr:hypothetical protein [Rhodospirillales bacterium]
MAASTDLRAFAADARTERTIRQGLEGRASVKVQRGKLREVLQVLASAPPSKLVLVDLDGASEPESAFTQLQAVCSFGTAFVAVGSISTSSFARQLLRDGFSDYLTKPLSVADVRNICAALLDEQPGRDYAGNVVGFAGSGGSGVAALAAALARESQTKGLNCVLLSFDPIFPQAFGLEPAGDVSEMLLRIADGKSSGFEPFEDLTDGGTGKVALVTYPHSDSLPVVPSVDTAQSLIGQLANRASIVLLCGIPDPELLAALMNKCDARVVLYEPTLLSINVAVRCLVLLDTDNPPILVQSNRRGPRHSLSSAQIRYALGDREPAVTLPYDRHLHSQIASIDARPSASRKYRKALTQAVDAIFERIR